MWDKKLTVSAAAFILAGTGLVSNILGLFRERLIAGHFGASHETDIFYASFRIPDLIFNLLILGALSSVFIPIFVEKLTKNEKEKANDLASSFMNFILICAIVFGVIVFILAPKLVPFLLPGFFNRDINTDINTYDTTVNLIRIMLLSPIFFSISGIFGGILNSHKRFIAYSLAPIIYNVSIILSMIFLVDRINPQIYAPAIGVVAGAFFAAAVQLPSVLRTGWRWRMVIDFQKGEIPRMIKMMVPRTLTIGANQINIVVDTIVLSFFVGGISVFNYANNIQTVPTVIFGIAIATAIFPALSESHAKKDMDEFIDRFSWSARRILFFMIPATVGIIVLRAQIVRLIFGIGSFDWEATYWTTKTLLFFSFGLVAQGLIPLLIRAFYAIQDTRNPFY
ncbi:MAG: murein biosynthesis integral membrane protein MurJ, partial [Patescibacteria group bacterium]